MARIWDPYLSEADKAHLAVCKERRVGFGSKPALLMVDLYRAVFGDQPEPLMEAIKTWPSSCGLNGWNALPRIQELLKASRAAGIPILHVTMLTDSGIPTWLEASSRETHKSVPPSDPAALDRQRRGGDIIDEVAPLPGEFLFKKTAPSCFWGTALAAQLTYLGIDTLLVAGESTSGCVRATVVEGAAYRYRMQVIEDCVFDRHDAPHAMNLFDMHTKYADVISLRKAVDYLAALRKP